MKKLFLKHQFFIKQHYFVKKHLTINTYDILSCYHRLIKLSYCDFFAKLFKIKNYIEKRKLSDNFIINKL